MIGRSDSGNMDVLDELMLVFKSNGQGSVDSAKRATAD